MISKRKQWLIGFTWTGTFSVGNDANLFHSNIMSNCFYLGNSSVVQSIGRSVTLKEIQRQFASTYNTKTNIVFIYNWNWTIYLESRLVLLSIKFFFSTISTLLFSKLPAEWMERLGNSLEILQIWVWFKNNCKGGF